MTGLPCGMKSSHFHWHSQNSLCSALKCTSTIDPARILSPAKHVCRSLSLDLESVRCHSMMKRGRSSRLLGYLWVLVIFKTLRLYYVSLHFFLVIGNFVIRWCIYEMIIVVVYKYILAIKHTNQPLRCKWNLCKRNAGSKIFLIFLMLIHSSELLTPNFWIFP